MRSARTKYVGEIDQTDLLSSGWKAKIGARDHPAAMPIGNFETQRACLFVCSLADCDVDRGIRRMQPAFGYEISRSARRHLIAQIYFDVMIARDALVLAASKGIEITIIQVAH